MKKRKDINDKIVAWIINKVKTEYADDISLVLIYGSYINGTAHGKSDVDCYYIPKTERGYHLAADFIIDGVGYDIFPVSWERAVGIADLQESLSLLIGDAEILYYSDSRDLERFMTLQERLKRNLSDEKYVRDIAVKRWEQANKICAFMKRSHRPSDIRKLAGAVIMTLAGLYEEISSTFQKIYVCCENGNYILAFLSAVCLQNELDEAGEAGCPYYDLLGAYKYTDLGLLSKITRKIESDFVQLITENGGCIKRYDNFEQFEAVGL